MYLEGTGRNHIDISTSMDLLPHNTHGILEFLSLSPGVGVSYYFLSATSDATCGLSIGDSYGYLT